jgi:hypothetical protein
MRTSEKHGVFFRRTPVIGHTGGHVEGHLTTLESDTYEGIHCSIEEDSSLYQRIWSTRRGPSIPGWSAENHLAGGSIANKICGGGLGNKELYFFFGFTQ